MGSSFSGMTVVPPIQSILELQKELKLSLVLLIADLVVSEAFLWLWSVRRFETDYGIL